MFQNPLQISCPQCGSRNVEVRNTMPGAQKGAVGKGMDWLKELASPSGPVGMPMGQKFVVCKDCGNTSAVMFN